ncbi:MAG: SDR family NAD(P)-dependent oxidoreductase, partial [Anaerolineae bacterium]|nr:SDR family NAD(P)-dependent oxidoreductase [Anaerolineae bacterium]
IVLSATNEERLRAYSQKLLSYLEANPDVSLIELAYTLQVGREAMACRLASVVSSIEELVERLRQYAQKQNATERIYSGQTMTTDFNSETLIGGKAGAAFIQVALDERDLDRLAHLWVSGVQIDWSLLYGQQKPRRISLPTYPFARERYWGDGPPHQPKSEILRPLIERMVASPLIEGSIFETEYSLETVPFLADHHVFGQVVVPGMSHISMVLSAIELAFDESPCRLEDIVFPQALVLAEHEIRTVQLLIRLEAGTTTFQVISTEKNAHNDEPVTHALGQIIIGQSDNPAPLVIQTVQKRCTKLLTHEAFYDAFHKMVEIRYGPCFRWIDAVWIGPDETLGRLRLPTVIDSVTGYQLYPGLIDACTQLTAAATLNEGVIDTVIPFSIETFRFYGSVDHHLLWGYVKQVGEKKWDIQLLDPMGQLVAAMTGFTLRSVPPAAIRSRQWYLKRLGYTIEWQDQPVQNKSGESSGIMGNWLIIGHPDGMGEVLATQLQDLGAQAVLVTNPDQTDDLQKLLQAAPYTDGWNGWDGIVLLAETEPMTGAVSTVPDMAEKLCSEALRLVQALEKVDTAARLWLVTEGCQNVEVPPQQPQDPVIDSSQTTGLAAAQGALWGLGLTIGTEYPQLHCTCVDLAGVDVKSDIQALLTEFRSNTTDVQVAYRQGIRYVARLARWHESRAKESSRAIELQQSGSYLITGGLGALGRQVAQQLAAAGAGHLILAGRGGLKGENDRAQIRLLKEAGAKVHVIQADVSQPEEVARLLQTCEAQGPLRGIIHAAGILDDGVLSRQTPERFAKVMAPKVRGTWHLHNLSQAYPLDFFICFSSMAAWLGSAGQGNYVAANAFMDTLMSHRHRLGLPGLSINWGPWAEAGMAAESSQGRRDWWHERGLNPITPEQGRSVLRECLNQEAAQVGILSVDWSIFLKNPQTESSFYEKIDLPAVQRRARPAEIYEQLKAISANERYAVLNAYLHGRLVEVIGLRSDQMIGSQQPLFDLGIDSMLALELKKRLETDLGYSLPSTVIFDYPTLDALTEFLMSKMFGEVSEDMSPKTGDELDPARLAEINQLSDDELTAVIDAEFNALLSQDKEG